MKIKWLSKRILIKFSYFPLIQYKENIVIWICHIPFLLFQVKEITTLQFYIPFINKYDLIQPICLLI